MKTLAITVMNSEQEIIFTKMAIELGLEVSETFKPLTARDAARGLGRKYTSAELVEYLSRNADAEPISQEELLRRLDERSAKAKS